MLSIKSTSSNRELQIRRGQGGYFIVEILGHRVAAQTEVWIDDDAPSLGRFFTDLGAKKAPWNSALEWGSLEGDLYFSVTCTSLGSVTFDIRLEGMPGAPEKWSVHAGLETEFGQLTRIASEAQELVEAKSAY
ncbi:DUF6228 family protein [Acidovorax sp. NPDC077693]|uniref:DUF6228 family protein n=1 Tax=unclassified Acidovorax TaxID=2684926 RepID=UPI0037C5F2B4